MSLDAYSPCPCGSGKKLKFCCAGVAGEIEKIERLLEGRQRTRAVQALDALLRKHPDNPWAVTAKAEVLIDEGAPDAAAELLEPFVESHGDHHYALALFALASFSADGFELAKPVIHRAFQRCLRDYPGMLADLALGIASAMLSSGRSLAARAHLVLSLRLAPDDLKSQIFMRLMDFDGNPRVPFPLRSVHDLVDVPGAGEKDSDAHKAVLLSQLGCWRPAARLFAKLAEANPEDASVWYNAGLCRAWDGDEALAAEALHAAAKLQQDFETAVEWETVAQLLDHNTTQDRIRIASRRYQTDSVTKLLLVLDEDERLSREPLPPPEAASSAIYYLLDDPGKLQQSPDDVTLDSVANIVAQVTVFEAPEADEVDDEEDAVPHVYLTGNEGPAFESAVAMFEEAVNAAGVSLELDEDEEDPGFRPSLPRELAPLMWQWQFPDKTPIRRKRDVEREMWDRVASTIWPDEPQAALDGKSPRQAAAEPGLRVALRAAINVLDAYCDRDHFSLDVGAVAGALNIEPPPEFTLNGQSLNQVTSLELRRIDPAKLDDEQLATMLRRAALIHHTGLLYNALSQAVTRPALMDEFGRQELLTSIAELCHDTGRRDEALRWIREGREHASDEEDSFKTTLKWAIQELKLRLEDPGDPELMPLLKTIGDTYLRKLPELREPLTDLVTHVGLTPPWDGETVGAAESAGELLWTPGGEQRQAADGGKKLWLPGQ